jgi:hypothetical protein
MAAAPGYITLKPLPRRIHLRSGTWTYRVGPSGVQIRDPELTRTVFVRLPSILGVSWDAIERSARKCCSIHHVKPQHVRDYIVTNLEPVYPMPCPECGFDSRRPRRRTPFNRRPPWRKSP